MCNKSKLYCDDDDNKQLKLQSILHTQYLNTTIVEDRKIYQVVRERILGYYSREYNELMIAQYIYLINLMRHITEKNRNERMKACEIKVANCFNGSPILSTCHSYFQND